MKRRPDNPHFPDDISDETASVLSDFLYQLATDCENHYLPQLRRYNRRQRQMNLYDPEEPWKTPPPDHP